MKTYDYSPLQKITRAILLTAFSGLFSISVLAQQSDRPFSVELNAGGGLIGNSTTSTAFQPELGVSYMPGRWGVGLNAGLYSFGSGFSADQYRTGFEQYTIAEQSSDRWNALSINAGPRFQQSLSRLVQLNVGLDLAMNYQKAPSQSVRFFDPTGEMDGTDFDSDMVLADMNGGGDAGGWSAAVRPQVQMEFTPGFSNRFSFTMKTGIQHHLSDRDITYTERDLSRVRQVDNVYEMHHQFENAPVVERTESAPKTNFFANAGIKISFGGSRAPAAPAQDYNSSRSNKPNTIADIGDGDPDSDGDGIDDAIETAQDYNSSRSNKPNPNRAADIGEGDPDSDGDGIDDAIETAQDYNSSRSNKPNPNRAANGGDEVDIVGMGEEKLVANVGGDENGFVTNIDTKATINTYGDGGEDLREAIRMASIMNPAGIIISAGPVMMSSNQGNPLYEGKGQSGNNPMYEGQANDGDSGDDSYGDPVAVQRFHLQPSSYCVELSTMKISTNSQQGMRSGAQNHNSSRSNKTEGVSNPDLDGDGFPEIMKSASFSISKRSARTGRSSVHQENSVGGESALYEPKDELANNGGDSDGEVVGYHFELEIDDPDSDGDGVSDEVAVNDDNNDGEKPDNQKIDTMDIVVLVPGRAGVVQSIPVNNFDTIDNAPEEKERGILSKADAKKALDGFIRSINNNAPPGAQIAPSQVKVIVMGITHSGDTPPLEESKQRDSELVLDSDRGGIVSDQVLKTFFQTGDKPTASQAAPLIDSMVNKLDDVTLSATYSISKRSARTGRNESQENPLAVDEMEWVESAAQGMRPPNNVYQWTYKLSSMAGSEDFPAKGTLNVLFTGGAWHFDVQIDPDNEGDGIGELLQNSSFSISKRSARQ
jgi:hypothetical protein